MRVKTVNKLFVLGIVLMLGIISIAIAAPGGPGTVTKLGSERRTAGVDGTAGTTVVAQAGNITRLFINSTRLTENWQGYYGNITGQIVLDDANSRSMYDWQIANPTGEIYAANGSSVTWTDVTCVNLTGNSLQSAFNETSIESGYGIDSTDNDGVGETFNGTFTGSFTIGSSVTIDSTDSCSHAYLYVNDAGQSTNYEEVLLTDNASIIWTALLEQDGTTGFDGGEIDFQMLVTEDGSIAGTSDYYFFVELS